MNHLLSVLTPVHPAKFDYLDDAYKSLVGQTLPTGWTWEWIIQQDGQQSTLLDFLNHVAPNDSRINYHTGRAGGPAIARTMALSHATGELIKVLDADDQLAPDALARDITVLDSQGDIGWTTSRVLDLLSDGSTVGFDFDPPPGPIDRGDVLQHWRSHDYRAQVHPATLCVRRSLLLVLGGWMALPASEDTGLLLALNAVSTGYFIEQPGLFYRKWHGQSTASVEHSDPEERRARMTVIEARAQTLFDYVPIINGELDLSDRC